MGTQYWYTGSCGGVQIGTGPSITLTPAVTTTYYVNNFSNNQFGPSCASITITVGSPPAGPTANSVILCGPGSATLTASGAPVNSTYTWYANANGTNPLASTPTYTTPILSTNTAYYVGYQPPGNAGNGTATFNYTGSVQTFTAPATTTYNLSLRGGRGGNGLNTTGGLGGQATGSLALTAGQTISIYVGGQGGNAAGPPGWNGGGQGGLDVGAGQHGGSGGGASDIRVGGTALANRVIVAGGGAGGGRDGTTGVGGGASGTNSTNFNSGIGGTGGTQVAGGVAGILTRGATNGALGQGGAGSTGYNAAGGGGGGGGYYGGGGGTSTQNHGSGWSCGGGGGSSFTGGVVGGTTSSGVQNGNGQVIITWTNPGCPSALTPVTVTINPLPTLTVNNATICAGQIATLTANVSSPGGNFTWTPGGQTGATITVTPNTTTNYTVSYTVAGCSPVTATSTVTVNPLQPISGALSVCLGQTSQLNNAVTPGTWTSSNPSIASISAGGLVTGVSAGTSTITYNASNGCSTTSQFTVYPQPVLSATANNVQCFGGTGSVTLSASGANAPYTYGGAATQNLSPGTYTYTATSVDGCISAPVSVTIVQPQAALTLSTTQINVLCSGNSSGSIDLTVSGGTAPYTYAWSNNTTLEDPSNLLAGTYTVTVTDANGCTATTTVTITQPGSAVTITATAQNILCLNGTGSVSSTPNGGVSPYTFSWTNSANTQNITNLQAGSYTVTVQDANGCSANATAVVATTLSQVPVQILNLTGTTILTCTNPNIVLQATGGVTYNWSGGLTPSNDTNSITAPGTYTVNMIDPNGCPVSQTITLTQNITLPSAAITNATGTTIIDCNAPNISLQATGGGGYQWNNNLGSTANVIITQPGSYTVVVTAANGCQDSATLAITLAPVPSVTGLDTTICAGQSVTINPTYYPSGGQVIWTNGQATPTITVTPGTTTLYSVLYTWNGCTATEDITVTVNPTPTLTGSTANICFGDTTTLTATPNIPNGAYNWITTNESTQSISVSPQATTTYNVSYTLNGCTSQLLGINVNVTPLPILSVNNVTICQGQSGTLTASTNVPGGVFSWSQGGANSSITESPTTNTTYSVSYVVNGCLSAPTSAMIIVNPLPTVSFSADTTSGCVPVSVTFSADTTGQLASYQWTSNGVIIGSGATLQTTFSTGGCYDIGMTATLNVCSSPLIQNDFICVQDFPQASFVPNPPSFSESSQTISFTNNSIGATGYVWNFGDGNVSNEEFPTHYFQNTSGGYSITLIATTSMGCMDSVMVDLQANLGATYYIPNTFTPDGDKYNQVFKPVFATGVSSEGYEMLVFNRWGEVMFESHNMNVGWDGSYGTEGLDCPPGTYTYKISFTLIGGLEEPVIVTGHLNLLR
jgi:gliding motility-associated-like protein